MQCLGCFTQGEMVPILQEAVLAPGPVLTGANSLTPKGILSPYRPVRTESQFLLCYSGPLNRFKNIFVLYYDLKTLNTGHHKRIFEISKFWLILGLNSLNFAVTNL